MPAKAPELLDLFYSILFYIVPFHSVLFCPIQSYSILFFLAYACIRSTLSHMNNARRYMYMQCKAQTRGLSWMPPPPPPLISTGSREDPGAFQAGKKRLRSNDLLHSRCLHCCYYHCSSHRCENCTHHPRFSRTHHDGVCCHCYDRRADKSDAQNCQSGRAYCCGLGSGQ